jgi:hypothetical protein
VGVAKGAKAAIDDYNLGLAFENVANRIEDALGNEPTDCEVDRDAYGELCELLCGEEFAPAGEVLEAAEKLMRKVFGGNRLFFDGKQFHPIDNLVSQETDGGENDGEK